MTSPIILYDIPSTTCINAWSPNVWKTRYALNIKGIPHKTVWVEYPDIAALAKEIGALPTGTTNGAPWYTVPIINDPNTGRVISDSFRIAEYLEATYPSNLALFPHGTKPLMAAFESGLFAALGPIFPAQFASSFSVLHPSSKVYFRATREARLGRKIEAFSPAGPTRDADLAKGQEKFTTLEGWLAMSDGKFVLGSTISYADAILAGWLKWLKVTDGIWEEVAAWQDGRWAAYLEGVENAGYASVY